MKNFKYILVVLLTINIACNNDDDIPNEQENIIFDFELNKDFLIGEKWFLNEITAAKAIDYNKDGTPSTDIYSQVQECDKDSFYTFDERQDNIALLYDSTNSCDNFFELYQSSQGIGLSEYEIDPEFFGGTLDFNENLLGNNKLFGSFPTDLSNVKFGIALDNSFKIIQGEYNLEVDGERILITYSLVTK